MKKLITTITVTFMSMAAQANISNEECTAEWLESKLITSYPTILDNKVTLSLTAPSGIAYRGYKIPHEGKNRIVLFVVSSPENTITLVDQTPGDPVVKKKMPYPYTTYADIARKNDEGCGATTRLSITNAKLAKAIRKELKYNPASGFNTSKLDSNWIHRARLQLHYNYSFILDNDAQKFTNEYNLQDRKTQQARATIETVKALADLAMLTGEKSSSNLQRATLFVQATGTTFAGFNAFNVSLNAQSGLPSEIVDFTKGLAGAIFGFSSLSRISALPGAASDLSKANLTNMQNHGKITEMEAELGKKLGELVAVTASCLLEPNKVSACAIAAAEQSAKSFFDFYGAAHIFKNNAAFNANIKAREYLDLFYKSAGDESYMWQASRINYPLDVNEAANFYAKQHSAFSFDKQYFIDAVNDQKQLIEKSVNLLKSKIER